MLAQFLGHIAGNWENFPIGYEKWQKIPESYKNYVWNNVIKPKLEVNDDKRKNYIFQSLAKNAGTIDVIYIILCNVIKMVHGKQTLQRKLQKFLWSNGLLLSIIGLTLT
ncbi:hypothetical protein DsansV1_C15g0137861 [Dioscorea sansibarensis]